MATTYTPNFNLGMQENSSDKFNMTVITENMKKIDSALQGIFDELAEDDTLIKEKANFADVYDKPTADTLFLRVSATAAKAEADGTGANIAESLSALRSEVATLTERITALETKEEQI